MLFRVRCVDRASGAQSDRLDRAETADRAAEMAMREGCIVGHVFPEADVPLAPAQPGRLTSYARKADRPRGVRAFFNFEVFLLPVLIRIFFALSLGVTLILTIAAPIYWLFYETNRSPESAMRVVPALAWSWLWVIGLRLLFEVMVVFFSVHDRLREISRNTSRQE